MAQADYELSVTVEVNTPSDDAYGGQVDSWATLVSGTATKHFFSIRQDLQRFEALPGPGTMTVTKVFFKFVPPFPSVTVGRPQDYRVVETVSGLVWPVQHIRSYSRTMQMDCEQVA